MPLEVSEVKFFLPGTVFPQTASLFYKYFRADIPKPLSCGIFPGDLVVVDTKARITADNIIVVTIGPCDSRLMRFNPNEVITDEVVGRVIWRIGKVSK